LQTIFNLNAFFPQFVLTLFFPNTL